MRSLATTCQNKHLGRAFELPQSFPQRAGLSLDRLEGFAMSQSPSVHAGQKRKLQDDTQSPGAESSTKNTTHVGSSEASKPKKKKAKNSSDRSSVFAFDSSDLRSRSKSISINVCGPDALMSLFLMRVHGLGSSTCRPRCYGAYARPR